MGAAVGQPEPFRFRRLEKPEDFRAAEEVQAAIAAQTDEPTLPVSVQRAFQDNGGLVVGAFVDVHLAGFAAGFLGWDGTTLFHYSHALAVRPEYQNHHVGFRLRAFEREEVLRQGLAELRWTYDPLVSRNALLSVRRLGGQPDRYHVHYYGRTGAAPDAPEETDRLRVVWKLTSPSVEHRLTGMAPSPADDASRLRSSTAIVETEISERGFRVPSAVAEPNADRATIEIPFDLGSLRAHEPEYVRRWRHAVRDAFRAALDLGYEVDDFAVVSEGHERRSYYFLSRATAVPSSVGSGSSPGAPAPDKTDNA